MADGGIETEAKWRASVREHERLRRALRQLGGVYVITVEEMNTLFDTAGGELKRRGHVLRLRRLDEKHTVLTFKGPATYGDGMKVRSETELPVSEPSAMIGILRGLGFTESLEYRKTRETWELGGVEITLDTLDFGRFVEIEGTRAQIRRAAQLLSLDMARTETMGYPGMMRAHRTREQAGS
jgi:adenylate cyclase class 2